MPDSQAANNTHRHTGRLWSLCHALCACTKCQVISNRREQMSEMLFGLVNSNCVRVLETVAGCRQCCLCCKCQMISLCCRYSCCLWLLTCPATNDPNPCHMLCRLPLPLTTATTTTTRATLTQFQLQLQSCGPAQATSVRLFNEISKHCKCVQLSKCCTHPPPAPTPLLLLLLLP